MSSYAETYSQTYTVVDVGKVVDCFAADLDMIAQATTLWTRERAQKAARDIKLMAQNKYLKEANICLFDANGILIRAAKYEVSEDASLWTTQRPGNNLWPKTTSGDLQVIITRTKVWTQAFQNNLQCDWGTTTIDTSFRQLARRYDRDYTSNAFGLRKSIFS
jgi:Bacterial HORMA domain family 1